MIANATVKHIRVSASKLRLVIDLVRGKTVEEAVFILDNINKGAAHFIKKVLNSAFSNANNNRQNKFIAKELFIRDLRADGGPMFKRFRAATMGRAAPIRHRTSHIYVALERVGVENGSKG